MTEADDRRFMLAAVRLSRRNEARTAENPSVGCIVVRHGRIVGRGVTAVGGRPHAERVALDEAAERARGATAYVTLEPCAHHGQTPPCAKALIEAGISRVVIGVPDPDPRVDGQGISMLRDAEIDVSQDVVVEQCRDAMAGFLTRVREHRPHVTLKLAISLDGFLGREGTEVAVTGPEAKRRTHLLRARSDAILVGSGTVLADDPELTCRLPGLKDRSPHRYVVDRRNRTPRTARVLSRALPGATTVLDRADLAGSGDDRCAPTAILQRIAMDGHSLVLLEGGRQLAASFIEADAVDEIVTYLSPDILAGDPGRAPIRSPLPPGRTPKGFVLERDERLGRDRAVTYRRSA